VLAYLQLVGRDKWDRRESDDRTIAEWKTRDKINYNYLKIENINFTIQTTARTKINGGGG
jgi:hypothetical protein